MKHFVYLPALVLSTLQVTALAQDAQVSVGAAASPDSGADASATGAAAAPAAPTQAASRAPEAGLFELGLFGGLFLPSSSHNLQAEPSAYHEYDSIAPELGLRLAYFPWAALGVEAEGAIMPSSVKDGEGAGLWAGRGHLVLQLTSSELTPFLVAGAGALGANSQEMGSDSDFGVHFGAGVKLPLDDVLSVRLDLRDTLSQGDQDSGSDIAHHLEGLLGLTFTIDRSRPPPPPPPDSDGDGVEDASDKCPTVVGVAPDGCPADSDGDKIIDADDQCPTQAGPAPTGCPPPPDRDGDGVIDEKDECPDQAGPMANGCPDPDPDKDGVLLEHDKCPTEPETVNGFQDADGCPDEIPEAVKRFSGVIQGIEFDFGKATIRPVSRPLLDQAAQTLTEYADLKLLISGHTDNVGARERNLALSLQRAESVRQYLIDKGIDASRLQARGAGPDEPLSTENTKAAQQKNRRIEFKIATP